MISVTELESRISEHAKFRILSQLQVTVWQIAQILYFYFSIRYYYPSSSGNMNVLKRGGIDVRKHLYRVTM